MSQGENNVKIALYISLFAIVGALLAGFLYVQSLKNAQKAAVSSGYSHTNTVNSVLRDQNQPFAQAETLAGSTSTDDQAQRVDLYRKALQLATDKIQQGHIKYKEAVATRKTGDYLGAAALFKEIGATEGYSVYDRAYAIQALGNIFYTLHDPKIMEATFSSAPYAARRVDGDINLSYRKLYEYAASIYPLAGSEARVADWYANDLLDNVATLTEPEVKADMTRITEALANVDKDVERTKDDPNAKYDIPDALLRKAVVLGKLAVLKLGSTNDAENAFDAANSLQVLQSHAQNPYFFLHYANYLAYEYGQKRVTDIRAELANLSNYTAKDPVIIFLKNERSNIADSKPELVNLTRFAPNFKKLLLSLGWAESDFGGQKSQ